MKEIMLRQWGHKFPASTNCESAHLWELLNVNSPPQAFIYEKGVEFNSAELNIEFAEIGGMSRKVIRRSNYRMTHKLPSIKNGSMVHCESKYEMYTCQLLEILINVVSYRVQPAIFKYVNESGEKHLHYPDIFLVLRNGKKCFIEVKPNKSRNDIDLVQRTSLITKLLKIKGYQYYLIFPEQVASLAYLNNAQLLLRHAAPQTPFPVIQKIRDEFIGKSSITLSSLITALKDLGARRWIFKMIIDGQLQCDLSIPVNGNSLLTFKNE